jgi:hypothetical protein
LKLALEEATKALNLKPDDKASMALIVKIKRLM